MLRMILSQVQRHRGRASALAAGILVAAISFSLLTAAAATQTAEVSGTVQNNLRPAYDILVRPRGSTTPIEKRQGLVQDNYLSGIFGGITLNQLHLVQGLPGVQVAAPIAMIGYVLQEVVIPIDVTDLLGPAAAQVLTITDTRTTDRGLTSFPTRSIGYVYVTGNQLRTQLSPGVSFIVTPTTVIGTSSPLREASLSPSARSTLPQHSARLLTTTMHKSAFAGRVRGGKEGPLVCYAVHRQAISPGRYR